MFSSSNVSGAGVYWMYYAGGSFEAAAAPGGLAGLTDGADVEGLRWCVATSTPGPGLWKGAWLSMRLQVLGC